MFGVWLLKYMKYPTPITTTIAIIIITFFISATSFSSEYMSINHGGTDLTQKPWLSGFGKIITKGK
jgi:hypothetical protein